MAVALKNKVSSLPTFIADSPFTPPMPSSPINANAVDPFSGFALEALFDESTHNANAVESAESESDFDSDEEVGSFQDSWLNVKEPEETKTALKMTAKNLLKDELASIKYKKSVA